MVNGAARESPTLQTFLSDFMKRFQILESNLRDRRGFSSTETKPIGTSSGASSAGITGFLKDTGDQITGPFAFAPAVNTIVNGEIDISVELGISYTSYVLLNPEAGVTDTLDRIQGAAFPGQIVTFQITNASVIFSNVNNIQGNDVEVQAGNTISFIFDASLDQEWKAWSGAGGGAGSFPILYPIDDFGDQGAVNLNIDISGTSGQNKRIRMTGSIGFAFVGLPDNTVLEEFWITFQQDGTGGREITTTVPATLKNASQLNILLDKTANSKTTFHFITEDAGASFRADLVDLTSGEFLGPWTADHNAGSKFLTKLQGVTLVDAVGLDQALFAGIDTGTRITLTSGKILVIRENVTDVLEVSANGLLMKTNKVINMSKSIINTVGSIEFDRTTNFNPTTILALGFDLQTQSMLYNMPLTSDSHRFRSGGENLATISRIGSNQGQVDTFSIAGDIHTIRAQAFFGSAPIPSPLLNGAQWRDQATGLFQFRENGITQGLAGSPPALSGLQDVNLWVDSPTSEFGDEVFHSNSKQGGAFTNTGTSSAGVAVFVPIFIGSPVRMTKIGIYLASAAAGFTLEVALYTNRTDGQNYPETRLELQSDFHNNSAGTKVNTISATDLATPGLFWLAIRPLSTITIMKYLTETATSVGWHLNTSLDIFAAIHGFFATTTLGGTAPDDMTAIEVETPSVFAKLELIP